MLCVSFLFIEFNMYLDSIKDALFSHFLELPFRRLFVNKCVFIQGFLRLHKERGCDVYR